MRFDSLQNEIEGKTDLKIKEIFQSLSFEKEENQKVIEDLKLLVNVKDKQNEVNY